MPNWKKILTSGSNIQISELTLQAAGVHKASIDTSGNIAAEGDISASSALFGRALTVASAGATKASIDTSGNIASEGYISSSGKLSGTDIDLRTNGVQVFAVNTDGIVNAEGGISSSGVLSGTSLDLRTAGTQKAAISADGSASFAGGIDTFHDATASLGYITASQLIVQGTDQGGGIHLLDNDGNNIAAFARCGSGGNAHKGRMVLRDNADIKIELTPIGTSYVMGAFSSSGAIEANSFEQTSNGTTLAQITNQGVINAKMGLITHTIGANTGDVVYFGGTTSMTTGKIYHYKSDGTWELADCNAAANSDGLLAVALGAASDTNGMLLRGMATLHTIDGTEAVGDVLYLSEDTTGNANSVAPAGNGDIVRVIGYCLHASNKTIWFNPDNTFVEVTA